VARTPPVRIVLDTSARLPLDSQLARTADLAPVWLFCATVEPARIQQLTEHNIRVFQVERGPGGVALSAVLDTLWNEGIRSVLCEGGAQLSAEVARAGRIDRLYHFVAPRVLGAHGLGGFDEFPAGSLAHLVLGNVQRFGKDVLLTYDRARTGPPLSSASERERVVHGFG
jgi:diaminohydroxyphosphoribosylaminopyrimidine deaminase / 5-amino-6-(5-phosphoribosylamino)uracil reductase